MLTKVKSNPWLPFKLHQPNLFRSVQRLLLMSLDSWPQTAALTSHRIEQVFPKVLVGRKDPEPQSVPVEQFPALFHFEQQDKVAYIVSKAELPIDLDRRGQDDFV
jgi:hypothetical protein